MANISGLNYKISEMAHRIRELREIMGYTIAEMAMKTDVTQQEYIDCESGKSDLNFAFIYRCALAFNVDVTDIIQGSSPRFCCFCSLLTVAGGRGDSVKICFTISSKSPIAATASSSERPSSIRSSIISA